MRSHEASVVMKGKISEVMALITPVLGAFPEGEAHFQVVLKT